MFKWIKNQMLAKIQVEKFISCQYVLFINEVLNKFNEDKPLQEILQDIANIKVEIIKKYNLTDKDFEKYVK